MLEVTRDRDRILTIRLAHGKANAMDLELVEAIARAFAEAAESDAKAVVVTGAGPIFSAGVDLFRLTNEGRDYAERFVPALARMLLDVFSFPKPFVAAVNGHAIAGGCILTLCADYRLMAEGNGLIGMPELLVGVPFPAAVVEIVRFAVPTQHLQSLMYTGKRLLPDEALRLGVVDEVVPPDALVPRATEMARALAAHAPANFQRTKRQLRDKTITWARHYANETDGEVRATWSDAETHARIREYLARTIRK